VTPRLAPVAALVFLVVAGLLPIVNPLGSAPIFLALTAGLSTPLRRWLAWRIAVNGFVLLVVSIFIGSHVLDFFGLSLPVVQVGGGLVVTATGWRLLHEPEDAPPVRPAAAASAAQFAGRAFYPLTLPLTVGPGSISVAIALGANTPHAGLSAAPAIAATVTAVALVAACIYVCYRYAENIAQILGETGTTVLLRLSSFIVVCIGVQITWNGVQALLASVVHTAPR
jgi:multiple antibiotic resistance protein